MPTVTPLPVRPWARSALGGAERGGHRVGRGRVEVLQHLVGVDVGARSRCVTAAASCGRRTGHERERQPRHRLDGQAQGLEGGDLAAVGTAAKVTMARPVGGAPGQQPAQAGVRGGERAAVGAGVAASAVVTPAVERRRLRRRR